jgi:hypothetical protein
MNKLRAVLAIVLPCLLLLACSPMPTERRQTLVSTTATPLLPKLFEGYRAVLLSGLQNCGSTDCDVEIDLRTEPFGGKDYCLATLPASLIFSGAAPGNQPKTITWRLKVATLGGFPVEFHEDSGILKVDDGHGQFDPDPKRTTSTVFKGKNKHKKKDSEASYVPVILWRKAGGLPELCGTADPRIVNN